MNMKMKQRAALSVIGVLLCSVSVGFFKTAGFGVDPFQSFCMGLLQASGLPLSYGSFYLLLNLILLCVPLLLARHYINVTTFINILFGGYVVAGTTAMLEALFPGKGLLLRIVFLAVGIVAMCFSSAMYYTAELGVSAYDAIPLLIAEKTKIPFRAARITADLLCLTVGFACGISIGIGTVITAFFMGPLIAVFTRLIRRHLGRPRYKVRFGV